MNRTLPENTAENCTDTVTALERQRARLKWQQHQLLHQSCFTPPAGVPADNLTGFPGFMSGGGGSGLSLVEMVMGAVKPDPGLEDGWYTMDKLDPSLLLNATAYELNSSISRTSSCPPAVAEKMRSVVGRESFKKRKAEKVHNTTNNKKVTVKEDDDNNNNKDKRIKTSGEEGESSKTTDQNSTKNNSVSTTTNNNRETSSDTSKENSKASEVQKPDYIHVRARRGQATDSHSLAERARREKISERMKYLQDLVPGCNKITGKAGMLDEIINYVQSLQRQVEFLSMKLATVNPRLDFNADDLFTKEIFPPACTTRNFPAMGGASSETTDPSSYIQFNPNNQQMVQCCGLETGINTSDFALRRTISAPVSFLENFPDSSCLTQFEPSSGWDVDLQNLYNVGSDQGRSSNAFSSLPFSVIFNEENDTATYIIKAVEDPRTLNKILYVRPLQNTISFNDLLSLWEKKSGTVLHKTYVSEEQLLKNIQEASYPLNFTLSVFYSAFVKGDLTNFDIEPSIGVEATQLYPDVEYTTVDEFLIRLL